MSRVVVTIRVCCASRTGHTFPVLPDQGWDHLIQRAGCKLGFSTAAVVGIAEVKPEEAPCHDEWFHVQFQENCLSTCACGHFVASDDALWTLGLISELPIPEKKHATYIVHVLPQTIIEEMPAAAPQKKKELPSTWSKTDAMDPNVQIRKSPSSKHSNKSPQELRDYVRKVWALLEKHGIYVPPVETPERPEKQDKFVLERHGHGRGNTKSNKKRRSKETKELLIRLAVHLEVLADRHDITISDHTYSQLSECSSSEDDLLEILHKGHVLKPESSNVVSSNIT